ncbi:TPA: hypothetical protein HA259_07555, partial [Thermoplasmata archaeon]|nr:hypothetical protein [Thermoplasmata archaeon]
MASGRLRFLAKDEIDRIHATALRVLDEVGVVIHSDAVKSLLAEAGARETKDGRRMTIPEELVREALRSAPKRILLASADGKNDIQIPSDDERLYVANGGEGVRMVDL